MPIRSLDQCPNHIPLIAQWWFKEFGPNSKFLTEKNLIQFLQARIHPNAEDKIWVFEERSKPIGSIMLTHAGFAPFASYKPQLYGCYVLANYAKQGYDTALLQEAHRYAIAQGLPALFLKTPAKTWPWFEQQGYLQLSKQETPTGTSLLGALQFLENATIFLKTPQTYLRALHPEDFEALHRLQSNPKVMRFLDGPKNITSVRARLSEWRAHHLRKGFAIWAVIDRLSHQFIGCAGLFHLRMDEKQPEIELAYALFPEVWGKGIATEVCAALVDHGLKQLQLKRIWAITRPENKISQKVLSKIGMHYTHTAYHQGGSAYFHAIQAQEGPLPTSV